MNRPDTNHIYKLVNGEYIPIENWYICKKCNRIGYRTLEEAIQCCKPNLCKECKIVLNHGGSYCSNCLQEQSFKKAKQVKYTGQVICKFNDDSFLFDDIDLSGWYDYLSEEEKAKEDYRFFVCNPYKWNGLDINTILENELEHHKDAINFIDDYDKLVEFIDKWNKKQDIRTYTTDCKEFVSVKEWLDRK